MQRSSTLFPAPKKEMKHITPIVRSRMPIDEKQVDAIIDRLATDASFTELNLDNNFPINTAGTTGEDANRLRLFSNILKALKFNGSITSFSLANNQLLTTTSNFEYNSDLYRILFIEFCGIIRSGLPPLTKLDIRGNLLTSDQVNALCIAIKQNRTLGSLVLSNCILMDDDDFSLSYLIDALRDNLSLQVIITYPDTQARERTYRLSILTTYIERNKKILFLGTDLATSLCNFMLRLVQMRYDYYYVDAMKSRNLIIVELLTTINNATTKEILYAVIKAGQRRYEETLGSSRSSDDPFNAILNPMLDALELTEAKAAPKKEGAVIPRLRFSIAEASKPRIAIPKLSPPPSEESTVQLKLKAN